MSPEGRVLHADRSTVGSFFKPERYPKQGASTPFAEPALRSARQRVCCTALIAHCPGLLARCPGLLAPRQLIPKNPQKGPQGI